ncbi:transposase [Beggiatoa sp. PS]|nr:transposase [Beggiatoa sp. PS]
MAKKYIVRLTYDERSELEDIVKKGKKSAYKRLHAQILLKADIGEEGPGWTDEKISEAFDVTTRTIERTRQRLVENGLEGALNKSKPQKVKSYRLDGEQEAHLIALTCGEPPEGYARWTLRLLAEQMVELEYVEENLSYETVRQVLKKNKLKPWQKKHSRLKFLRNFSLEWCIPPEANAEFVCNMEDVLEVYKKPYDPAHPVVCMDEASKQQIKEVRQPTSLEPGKPEHYDSEYERNGVSNLFSLEDPLAGWRHVEVTDQRTSVDWAYQIRDLVDVHYPQAELITLVMDNLNTHCGASLYKAFDPVEARRILERLDIHYTPKHGSWLNMAEIELSVLSSQCRESPYSRPRNFKERGNNMGQSA